MEAPLPTLRTSLNPLPSSSYQLKFHPLSPKIGAIFSDGYGTKSDFGGKIFVGTTQITEGLTKTAGKIYKEHNWD